MFLLAMALTAAVPTDPWVHVGGKAGDYEEFLDEQSVTRSGAKVALWTRRDFVAGAGTAWNELEFDCSDHTGTVLAYIEDRGGIVSHGTVRPYREAAPLGPGSVEEAIFKLVCR